MGWIRTSPDKGKVKDATLRLGIISEQLWSLQPCKDLSPLRFLIRKRGEIVKSYPSFIGFDKI